MGKPTPRPWRSQMIEFSDETWRAFLNDEGMRCITDGHNVIAAAWDTEDDDDPNQKDQFNAAHIVKCVNMHDELLKTLQFVLDTFNERECNCDGEYENGRLVGHTCFFHRIEEEVKEALAKAKADE